MGAWTFSIRKVISIVRGTYNAYNFQTRRTSGLQSHRTIASKYAFNNLELRTGSPTCSVVARVRSSASDQYSRRSHWILNPHNVNLMFAVNGWFMLRGSQICNGESTLLLVPVRVNHSGLDWSCSEHYPCSLGSWIVCCDLQLDCNVSNQTSNETHRVCLDNLIMLDSSSPKEVTRVLNPSFSQLSDDIITIPHYYTPVIGKIMPRK